MRRLLLIGFCLLAAVTPQQGAHAEEEPSAPAAKASAPPVAGRMTAQRVVALLRREKLAPEGDGAQVAFYVASTRVYANLDEPNDRMRFAVPLMKTAGTDAARFAELLKANYHATGDVRFALNRGVIWLVYVHRLSTLTEEDTLSAINQLAHHAERLTQP